MDDSTGRTCAANRTARVSCAESLDAWGSGCEDRISLKPDKAGLGDAAWASSRDEAGSHVRPLGHDDALRGDASDEFEFSPSPSQVDLDGRIGFRQDTTPVVEIPTSDWACDMEDVGDAPSIKEDGSVHNGTADGLRWSGGDCSDHSKNVCFNRPEFNNSAHSRDHSHGHPFTAPFVANTQEEVSARASQGDPKGPFLLSDSSWADPLRTPLAELSGFVVPADEFQRFPLENSATKEQQPQRPGASPNDNCVQCCVASDSSAVGVSVVLRCLIAIASKDMCMDDQNLDVDQSFITALLVCMVSMLVSRTVWPN